VCALITVLLSLYQSLSLYLFSWLYVQARRNGLRTVLAVPAALCVAEWLFPLLFEHYYGACLHSVPLAIQVADLGGPLLVSGLLGAFNAGVYELVRRLRAGDRGLKRLRDPIAVFALWALVIAYGAYRIQAVDAQAEAAPKLHMGLVQADMGLFEKRNDPELGLKRHLEQSKQLEQQHAGELDMLVWPESAFGWFLPEGAENIASGVLGDSIHTPTLFGGLALRKVKGRKRFFNTAFMTNGIGGITGSYDKTYLLTFSEYMPFSDTFPVLQELSPNSGNFMPGTHVNPLVLDDYRLSVLICYEDILPKFVRRVVREANPHVLINITNDAWFGDTHAPWEHFALAKFRAVEHHRSLVRSTNSGVTAFVDPVGRVVSETKLFTRENLYSAVPMMQGAYPYLVLGDFPGPLSLVLIIGAWLLNRRKRAAARAVAVSA